MCVWYYTQHGVNYARKLADFVETNVKRDDNGREVIIYE